MVRNIDGKIFCGTYHTMRVFPYKPFLQIFSDTHIPTVITFYNCYLIVTAIIITPCDTLYNKYYTIIHNKSQCSLPWNGLIRTKGY